MVTTDEAYFFGVLLGDGHIRYNEKALWSREFESGRNGPFIELRAIDLDFVTRWRDTITSLIGRQHAISTVRMADPRHRTQYKVRCGNPALVDRVEAETTHKTVIPRCIFNADEAGKKAFVTGLMDSEGWINCILTGLGPSDMTLGFGCCDPWFLEFVDIVQSLGIKTSQVYRRPVVAKKNGEPGNVIRIVRLDIRDYVNAGMSFTIRRKADRLAFCSRILNDYTRDYPRYADYYAVDDIV